jgi:hypothetical protein
MVDLCGYKIDRSGDGRVGVVVGSEPPIARKSLRKQLKVRRDNNKQRRIEREQGVCELK